MPNPVALSETDIANMALSHLGITTGIQALNPPDKSEQGKTCAFWYPKCRNSLLRSAPWTFAQQYITLTSDASSVPTPANTAAIPGWGFAYQYPSDCLQAVGVTTVAGMRLGPMFWNNWWWPYPAQNYVVPKIPYRIQQSTANPGNLAIYVDIQSTPTSPLFLFYIQCVTNTAQFDVLFSDALSFLIAWKVGGALRGADKEKIQYCAQEYEKHRMQAFAQSLNEMQQDLERDSPSVITRW